MDECSNESRCPLIIIVKDGSPPSPICEQDVIIALNSTGETTLFAESLDAASFDNCQDVFFKTIRMTDLQNTDHGSTQDQESAVC